MLPVLPTNYAAPHPPDISGTIPYFAADDKALAGAVFASSAGSIHNSRSYEKCSQSPRGVAEAAVHDSASAEKKLGENSRSLSSGGLQVSPPLRRRILHPCGAFLGANLAEDGQRGGVSKEARAREKAARQKWAAWYAAAEVSHPGWQQRADALLLAAAADDADALALYVAGTMHLEGCGTPLDPDAAIALLTRAAALGHRPSRVSLAMARLCQDGILGF
jgi:TPR repeat protein